MKSIYIIQWNAMFNIYAKKESRNKRKKEVKHNRN